MFSIKKRLILIFLTVTALIYSLTNTQVAKALSFTNTLPNGVAAGDTTQTSSVLWTRSTEQGNVTFEYSTEPDFSKVLAKVEKTVTDINQPVKVQINGLNPGTKYYYRVTNAANDSLTGQFKTALPLKVYGGLRFGVSGDWRGNLAPYTAIINAVGRDLDFFVAHGDTVYADVPSPAFSGVSDSRFPKGSRTFALNLDEFRAKHNEVYYPRYEMNTWSDLRASTSIYATISDHEVINNFAGGAPPKESDPKQVALTLGDTEVPYTNQTQIYKNALQAFQEYNPLRDEYYSNTEDTRTDKTPRLYRYNTFGSDAAILILDSRSFRDREIGIDPKIGFINPSDKQAVANYLKTSFDPTRVYLGSPQLKQLKQDLLDAQKKGLIWKFIMIPEPIQNLGIVGGEDHYEGYAAERSDLLRFIGQNKITNVVFVTADFHGTLINTVAYQNAPFGEQNLTKTWEIVTGPVAYDAPFGPNAVKLGYKAGLVTSEQKEAYESASSTVKEQMIITLVNNLLKPFGYPLLSYNTLGASFKDSRIEATLLKGGYTATNTYGWTEFEISPTSQKLLVTTYGIPPYTEADLDDPQTRSKVLSSQPPISIVSQFTVKPTK